MSRVPRRPRRFPSLIGALGPLVVAIVVAACTSASAGAGSSSAVPGNASGEIAGWPLPGQISTSGPVPVIASSQLVVGANRFLYTVVDSQNNPIASPSLHTKVTFYDLERDPAHPTASADGRFLWAIPNSRGFYVADATFDRTGQWGVQVDTSGSGKPASVRLRFDVIARGSTVPVGGRAPDVATPTLTVVGGNVHAISSDPNPDPAFYETSAADALAAHKPFVIVFATPAFCTSRVCGPTLDLVKSVAQQEPGFTFINVEPYELKYANGQLQPVLDAQGNLTPTKVTDAWGLQQEPWIFVVDGKGIVRDSFEAVVGADELKAAIDAVR